MAVTLAALRPAAPYQSPSFTVNSAEGASAQAPRFYRPELDLLRLLAFLMVWVSHALLSFGAVLPSRPLAIAQGVGSCGVPVFFFLSSFLIAELLRRERLATGSLHLGSFYVRRILRIWPLYFGILAAYGLLGLRFHGFRIEPGRLLASCLLSGNWYLALHPTLTTPLRSLWSISVEEQWYLLWPVLQLTLSRSGLLLICGVLFACAQVMLAILAHWADPHFTYATAWLNSVVQFQYLALGAAAALCLNGRTPRLRGTARACLCAGGVLALLVASGVCRMKDASASHSALSLICGYLLTGIGVALLFFALLGLRSTLCPAPLVRLGQLSFGLYIFHEAGIFLADALWRHAHAASTLLALAYSKAFALLLTALLAWVSYHVWEAPFLRLKRRWTLVRSRELP